MKLNQSSHQHDIYRWPVEREMRSLLLILGSIAGCCLAGDIDWWPDPVNRNEPCPYPNAHRADGGDWSCYPNCNDVNLEKIGKKDDRPCSWGSLFNACYCNEGFVSRSLHNLTCVPISECKNYPVFIPTPREEIKID